MRPHRLNTELRFGDSRAQPVAHRAFRVLFTPQAIGIAVNPGERLQWLGLTVETIQGGLTTIISLRAGESKDDDMQGSIILSRPELIELSPFQPQYFAEPLPSGLLETVPRRSYWFFFDMDSGTGVVAPHPRFAVGTLKLDRTTLSPQSEFMEVRGAAIDALFFRPGVGLWQNRIIDGGPDDHDGIGNRWVVISPTDFIARDPAGLAPPTGLEVQDVVLLVDEETLILSAFEVATRLNVE